MQRPVVISNYPKYLNIQKLMFNKIKAIKDMRNKAKGMQSMLAEIHCEGDACSGKVTVKLDGNQEVKNVKISPEMMNDVTKLEQAVQDAFNNALKKLHKELASKMKEMGGLDAFKDFGI